MIGLLETVLVFGIVLLVLTFLRMLLWHRRRMAEITESDPREYRGFRRQRHHAPWPKECLSCGMPANNGRQAKRHRLTCAVRYDLAGLREDQEDRMTWRVEEVRKTGEAGIDTLTDNPLELEQEEDVTP